MDIETAIGTSSKKDPHEAANEAVAACRKKFPELEADLAIVFSTANLANAVLLKSIQKLIKPSTPLIGCSAAALIAPSGILKEGVLLLLLSCPKAKISCYSVESIRTKGHFAAGVELAASILQAVKGMRREMCMVFSDGLLEDTSDFLKGMQNTLGTSFPIIGGNSADNLNFNQTYQFYNDKVFSGGAVAALFSQKLNFGFGIRHGWKPLGKIHTVTASYANIIQEIDGKKAAALYEDYFAKTLAQLQKDTLLINTLYPIGIYLDKENEYLLRNVMLFNNNGLIVTHDTMAPGSKIRLMIGTKDSCIESAKQASLQVKSDMLNKKIELLLVINSASRLRLLGRDAVKEISALKEILGQDTPCVGFYGYGQQAPLRSLKYFGQSYYHNQAIAILGMG